VGKDSYLKRTLAKNQVILDEKKMMRNMLIEPTVTDYMFNICDRMTTDDCPLFGQPGYPPDASFYNVADIRFRMSPLFVKNSDVRYSAKEMRRSLLP
jgi:hypothetical protein